MEKKSGLECILLIDDDDATNFIHKIIINKLLDGVHIAVAINGIYALEYLTRTGTFSGHNGPQPGIILLDINMPGMNGWEFLDEYRKLPEELKAKIVVAMVTTSLNPEDKKRAKSYNDEVREYFNKPLTLDHLREITDKYFEIANPRS